MIASSHKAYVFNAKNIHENHTVRKEIQGKDTYLKMQIVTKTAKSDGQSQEKNSSSYQIG